jgi:hypothetical protein
MEPSELLAPLYKTLSSAPTVLDPLEVLTQTSLPIAASPEGELLPANEGEEVILLVKKSAVSVPPFPPLRTLFRGSRRCSDFGGEPPGEYIPLFAAIEAVAADWCNLRGKPEYDEEFERLFTQLRRRPDGRDQNPLFGWLRRAAQLALLVRPTSEAEFEAITRRLARSARTFRTHLTSTNYWQLALRPMTEK